MSNNTDFSSTMNKLESTLHEYLVEKAPKLPNNIKDVLVSVAPWLTLIMVILSLPTLLGVIGLGGLVAPLAALTGSYTGWSIGLIILLIVIILEALAVPGLFSKTTQGWKYAYYATLVSGIYSLVNRDIIGLIFGMILSLYILFQIKEYYK